MGYLDPQTEAPRRPDPARLAQPDAGVLYLRSCLLMRAVIGFIGLALPFVLVLGDLALERGKIRGSLSFGASWLMKGLELRVLVGPKPAEGPLKAEEASTAG
jgi:hypothetical protein